MDLATLRPGDRVRFVRTVSSRVVLFAKGATGTVEVVKRWDEYINETPDGEPHVGVRLDAADRALCVFDDDERDLAWIGVHLDAQPDDLERA